MPETASLEPFEFSEPDRLTGRVGSTYPKVGSIISIGNGTGPRKSELVTGTVLVLHAQLQSSARKAASIVPYHSSPVLLTL